LAGEETLTKKSKRMKNLSSEDIIDKVNSMNPREYSKQQTELNAIDRKEKNKSMVADLKKKQGSEEEEKPMTQEDKEELEENIVLTKELNKHKDNLCDATCQATSCCMLETWMDSCV